MKNIHVLPTDKPSELYINMQGILSKSNSLLLRLKSRHIYITSDGDIKEGDWFICQNGFEKKCVGTTIINNEVYLLDYLENTDRLIWCKKIILTTDQDLIKDGVQAIDDKFLEWFVNNPSCELVNIRKVANGVKNHKLTYEYKIIIPTEELEHRWVGALVDENIEDIYEPYRCETKDLYTGNDCLPSFETKEECQAWCDSNNKKVEIKKETHNYLQGFINQFEEGGEHQEISNNDWTVSSFLQWLQLNNFKIIKIDNKE